MPQGPPSTSSPAPPTDPRALVMQRVADRSRRYPDLGPDPIDFSGLERRDAGLAAAIDGAVGRRWRTLAITASHALDRRGWASLEPAVKGAVLVGAAQLYLLDRAPAYAAINSAVEWVKHHARNRRVAGLVNGVLRSLDRLRDERLETFDPDARDQIPLADGGAWRLNAPVFAADRVQRLGEQSACSDELIAHWIRDHDFETAFAWAMHSITPAPTIVVDLAPDAASTLEAEELITKHETPNAWLLTHGSDVMTVLERGGHGARVQDPAARASVQTLASRAPHRILDFCAGSGTKTVQLAQQHPSAEIVATDVDAARYARLQSVAAAHDNVTAATGEDLASMRGVFDLIVLDVPCSNSGVLARRPEARSRFSNDALSSLVSLQRQIVVDALPYLSEASDAAILYATCSLETAENERQAAWMTTWHPLRTASAATWTPRGGPGAAPASHTDGGFHALLERNNDPDWRPPKS